MRTILAPGSGCPVLGCVKLKKVVTWRLQKKTSATSNKIRCAKKHKALEKLTPGPPKSEYDPGCVSSTIYPVHMSNESGQKPVGFHWTFGQGKYILKAIDISHSNNKTFVSKQSTEQYQRIATLKVIK